MFIHETPEKIVVSSRVETDWRFHSEHIWFKPSKYSDGDFFCFFSFFFFFFFLGQDKTKRKTGGGQNEECRRGTCKAQSQQIGRVICVR